MKKILLTALIITIFGCGGGSSESGGGQAEKNVTSCMILETIASSLPGSLEQVKYTNSCSFPVNFASGFTAILPENIVTLSPNQSVNRFTSLIKGYIACRPPSVPFDTDDGIGLALSCS